MAETENDISSEVYGWMFNHIWLIYAFSTVLGLVALRRYVSGTQCQSKVQLIGKTVLITGANTGIGKETARNLAKRGARVLLACRDINKCQSAADEIRKSTGNPDVVIYKLDLASLASVRQCASDVIAKEHRLDVLINNAGIAYTPYLKTVDGFELQFATNHLGHFLLTHLLLDLLKKSAPSRIVNVSSCGHYCDCLMQYESNAESSQRSFLHYFHAALSSNLSKRALNDGGQLDFDDLNGEKNYHPIKTYTKTKLCNILFTLELSKRLKDSHVTVNSLHPGVVSTEISRYGEQYFFSPVFRWILKLVYHGFIKNMMKTPAEGAQTSIHCAVAAELEGVTGKYFSECAVTTVSSAAKDEMAAAKLWAMSEEMVGIIKNK